MTEASSQALYPRYCFHLSPTVNTWCLLRISDVQALRRHTGFEGEDFYFYKNLPIKWIRVVGVVVAVEELAGRTVFTVDDSSGACIEAATPLATAPKPQQPALNRSNEPNAQAAPIALVDRQPAHRPYQNVDVGSVVDVKGKVATFRDTKEIKIEKLVSLKGTSQEIQLWDRRAKFRKEVLDKPWVLRDKDIRRCRREAERSNAPRERHRQRVNAQRSSDMTKSSTTNTATRGGPKPATIPPEAVSRSLKEIIDTGAKGKYSALGL